jgi:putative ABC transport system substrate-binding protein
MLRSGEEFVGAFAEMQRKRADAVIIQATLTRKEALDLALKQQVPSFSLVRELPAGGGLMSYSASFTEQHGETALYVDKILKGSKPAELPVTQPSQFSLVINLKTAKVLRITVPPSLIARADEVIE